MSNNKYKIKPIEVTAIRWYKVGDHPQDNCTIDDNGHYARPQVVLPYQGEAKDTRKFCQKCDETFFYHGHIENPDRTLTTVCPGDWIVTFPDGTHKSYNDEEFFAKFEKIEIDEGLPLGKFEEWFITRDSTEIPFYPEKNFTGDVSCSKCGIKFEGVMGYVCPNLDCPMGVGPVVCSSQN